MTKKRWARFSSIQVHFGRWKFLPAEAAQFPFESQTNGVVPRLRASVFGSTFSTSLWFQKSKILMRKVYGTVEMESQKVPNRNGMWSKLPTGDHFPAVNSDLLRASRWKGFKKGTRIRNEEWIWQERLIVNLQKERLTTDVRYQDWTEMTLDYIKMCWSQGAVVKGHFFCPQGGLPMRARVRQSS